MIEAEEEELRKAFLTILARLFSDFAGEILKVRDKGPGEPAVHKSEKPEAEEKPAPDIDEFLGALSKDLRDD